MPELDVNVESPRSFADLSVALDGGLPVKSLVDHRLALALEAARLGTWTWDMAAGTTVWDERLEELHGLAPGGFGGTFEDWLASLYPEDRAECLARVEAALANPGPYVLLHRTIWPDGSIHHIECRGTVLTDADGHPTGTTGVAIDVTQRERRQADTVEALARERELVEVLQNALLPTHLPGLGGVKVARRYLPARGSVVVGGDWYAVVPLPNARLGIAIGDVAGHGLDAVADMAAARFSLRALAFSNPDSPEVVLDRLNEVVRIFENDTMITAVYGVLDPAAGTWTYTNAGHCPVVVRDPSGATRMLDEGTVDPPLGVATREFHRQSAEIAAGSTLILYTDGLVERRSEPIDTGFERLRRAVEHGANGPEELCDGLIAALLGDGELNDDVAIVAVATEHSGG